MKDVSDTACVPEHAPKYFSMNDEGFAVAIDSDVPEESLDTAGEAKDYRPVSAIENA